MRVTLLENLRAVFYAPFYAAAALGAYRAEGLEVEIRASPAPEKTLESLAAGAAQVSWGGPLRILAALDRNPRCGCVAFCEVVGRDPFFLIGRSPNPAFRLEHLCGRTLATVAEVPTPWICLRHDLERAGIDPETVRRAAPRTMAENAAALRAGRLELIQVFEPHARALRDEGAGHLWYAAASRGPTAYTTLNTTRAFIERNPEAVLCMTRAMYRTLKWIAAHDGDELARAIRPYFPDLAQPLLAACCAHYQALGLWNRTPLPQRAGFEWLREAMLCAGEIRTRLGYEQCVDPRFAEAVMREDPPAL